MTTQNRRAQRAIAKAVLPALVIGTFCVAAARAYAQTSSLPGMTHDSIARLPDFGGWWGGRWDPTAGTAGAVKQMEPFWANLKPEAAEKFNKVRSALFGSGDSSAPPTSIPDFVEELGQKPYYCLPPRFVGDNGGFLDAVEFLFTPGRVTITNESGMIRRVFLNRPVPTDADESYMGTSVGHWEGQTLVVETVGLDSGADAAYTFGSLKLGRDARIVERISLRDSETLEIALTLTAPEIYTAPVNAVRVFERIRDHAFHEATSCVENDRSVDPVTGRQRFDLTPPSDLPPPPR